MKKLNFDFFLTCSLGFFVNQQKNICLMIGFFGSANLSAIYNKNMFMTKIANEEDLYRILARGVKSKMDTAILLILSSSGMPATFIQKLTMTQLLEACDHFFEPGQNRSLRSIMYTDPVKDNRFPCFDFKNDRLPRIACCSPKALKVTFQYLNHRYYEKYDNDYLFINKEGNPIADTEYITTLLRKAKKEVGKYTPDGAPDIGVASIKNRFWHICENNLQGRYKQQVISLMKGEDSAANRNFYRDIKYDNRVLREHYETVVDYLAIRSEDDRINRPTIQFTTNFTY